VSAAAPTTTSPVPDASARRHPERGFWIGTSLCAAVGLAIRIAAVLGRPNRSLGGDAFYYHWAANLLVEGHGFINPFLYIGHQHLTVQTASWPPGFVWVLAMAAVVGFKSYFAQRIWCGIVGAIAVVVCGLAGREIGGRRVGVFVAIVIALSPNIWMSDEAALSETVTPLVVALVVWSAYRFWKAPSVRRAVVLGVCLSVTALCRDELTSLFIFLLVPLVLLARGKSVRERLSMLGAAVLVAIALIGPWVGYNLSRFEKPVFISDGLGVTLASADCAATWGTGRYEGFWSFGCAIAVHVPKFGTDETVGVTDEQNAALHYIRHHLDRLVPVTLAKIGRGFGFFRPLQQIKLDYIFDDRPYHWALVGLFSYYALLGLSIAGTVVLVRRRVTTLPLVAVTLATVLTMMVAFGYTRYRAPFEVVVAVLASVAIDGLLNVIRRPRPVPAELAAPAPVADPVGALA
jgi:4-amino-4-deoxy-L-arabinose transferase-like glycosyltransferase